MTENNKAKLSGPRTEQFRHPPIIEAEHGFTVKTLKMITSIYKSKEHWSVSQSVCCIISQTIRPTDFKLGRCLTEGTIESCAKLDTARQHERHTYTLLSLELPSPFHSLTLCTTQHTTLCTNSVMSTVSSF